jgi:predicted RNase H-like nuclease (RuvC/YqgF family)
MTSQLAAAGPPPAAASAAAAAAAPASEAALAARVAELVARLSEADARVEELLDEKADLQYDLDVMDRKVELLREEVRGGRFMRLHRWASHLSMGTEASGC